MTNTIRIHIANHWTAEEFAQLYSSIDALYIFFAFDNDKSINQYLAEQDKELRYMINEPHRHSIEFALGDLAGRISSLRTLGRSESVIFGLRDSMRDYGQIYGRYHAAHLVDALDYLASQEYAEKSNWIKILDSGNSRSSLVYSRSRYRLLTHRALIKEPLVVLKTEHASPGFTDLAGVAQVVEHIKEFIVYLINHYSSREERKLKNERIRHDNELAALEVLEKKLSILKDAGVDDILLQQLAAEAAPHVRFVKEAVDKGLITDVDSTSGN